MTHHNGRIDPAPPLAARPVEDLADRPSDEIAARVAHDRAHLAASMTALRARLRPSALAESAGRAVLEKIGVPATERPRPSVHAAMGVVPPAAPAEPLELPGAEIVRRHPLLAGAALLAAGAALAKVLPQGETERGFVRDTGAVAGSRLRQVVIDETMILAETALAAVATGIATGLAAAAAETDAQSAAPGAPPAPPYA
ncbi:hypothetical protein [Xinfangfangia pollutisoli]|uniref:hypothetical protein n=1 Tax=Xinfangfangia pollutisoli TaxID=2865960 RepID=UPI001CD466E7|nr:hypothetical protein [Xinfangfangia pollutisoli]